MGKFPKPSEQNSFLVKHVNLLRESLRKLTGKNLLPEDLTDEAAAMKIFFAPFVVVSHDTSEDPIFNYANQTALELFEMNWEEFTIMHSRESAELPDQEERARLLEEVNTRGFINHYSGIRISKRGKRFFVENAIVWNLVDSEGKFWGQAATFSHWKYI